MAEKRSTLKTKKYNTSERNENLSDISLQVVRCHEQV